MSKTIEHSFIDWEASALGFGYGTGEPYVLGALKSFFAAFGKDGRPTGYDYERLEAAVSPAVAWLLIGILCRASIIEYGTSPRYGWLTPEGEALKAFVDSQPGERLVSLVCEVTADYPICYPDVCNCGPKGYERGRVCQNPFWRRR